MKTISLEIGQKVWVRRVGFFKTEYLQGTVEAVGADGWRVLVRVGKSLVSANLPSLFLSNPEARK